MWPFRKLLKLNVGDKVLIKDSVYTCIFHERQIREVSHTGKYIKYDDRWKKSSVILEVLPK